MTRRIRGIAAAAIAASAIGSLAAAGAAPAAPTQTLGGPTSQRVGSLYVIDRVHQKNTRLRVSATVSVSGRSYRFSGLNRVVPPHIPQTVRLRLSGSALNSVRRALRRGKRLSARVTCTASNRTGRSTARRSIRLRA